MIRRLLDAAYLGSGYVAAFFLVLIGLAIVAQVVGRYFGIIIDGTEVAGFSMAASSFFALAHTFKAGAHVRVTLLMHRLTGGGRRFAEVGCCLLAAGITGYLAFYAIDLTMQSYRFNDISPGLLALPFWIPQVGMSAGLSLLTIALVDEAISILRGRTPSYAQAEDLGIE